MRGTPVVLLSALVLFAGACDDDGTRLSKAEFLKQGNAACKATNDKIDTASAKEFPNQDVQPDPAKFNTFVNETLIPDIRQEIDDLDDLTPPKDLQDDVDHLLSDVRDDLDKVKEDVNEDTAAFLNRESDPFADAKKKANEVGLTACGED